MTLNHQLLKRRMGRAKKMTNRRAGFDVERPKADIALRAVEANGAPVAVPLAAIRKRLADADAMGSKAGMRFEDAHDRGAGDHPRLRGGRGGWRATPSATARSAVPSATG